MNDISLHTQTALLARRAAWSRYWSYGLPHSLPGTLDMESDEPAVLFWRGVFSTLQPTTALLDIGTGNGALLKLAIATVGPEHRVRATGIDIADVDALAVAEADGLGIRLMCGVEAEQLPYADATFDLVVSQYGFEYTELARSAGEVARVLTTHGRVAFLMHDRASVLVRVAHQEAAHAEWLLQDGGVLEILEDVAAGRPGLERAATLAVESLESQIRASPAPALLLDAHRVSCETMRLCAVGRANEGVALAKSHRIQVSDALTRASELVAAALDERGLARLTQQFAEVGIGQTVIEPIHHSSGARLGTALQAVRLQR